MHVGWFLLQLILITGKAAVYGAASSNMSDGEGAGISLARAFERCHIVRKRFRQQISWIQFPIPPRRLRLRAPMAMVTISWARLQIPIVLRQGPWNLTQRSWRPSLRTMGVSSWTCITSSERPEFLPIFPKLSIGMHSLESGVSCIPETSADQRPLQADEVRASPRCQSPGAV